MKELRLYRRYSEEKRSDGGEYMDHQNVVEVIKVSPPPVEQQVMRRAYHYPEGMKRDRYALPSSLTSQSPVGYRTRISITEDQAREMMPLLSLHPPKSFVEGAPITDNEMFEESALGILSSRQSTNYYGQKQRTFGPDESEKISSILKEMTDIGELHSHVAYTHVVFTRPYRTPFTMLLTLAGHTPLLSLLSVPWRIFQKRFMGANDIPTIGYLRELHIGILADGIERAVQVASHGKRAALVHLAPFCGALKAKNKKAIKALSSLCKLSPKERRQGWMVSMVVQVGYVPEEDRLTMRDSTWRTFGANQMAFRSERIQPGVNHEPKAPPQYHQRQDMNVSEELTFQAGRAAYNAFSRWTGVDRERAKELLLSDRVDVLTPNGKTRLRKIRRALGDATDCLVRDLPLWADFPTGRAFSRNAARGRKAFALAGQRIYIMGLSKDEIKGAQLDWDLAICATGASAARSALYSEIMGCIDVPETCDLLAGVCLMAGPVNQNDIGKTFYGHPDLLDETLSARNPTSLLVWTLKAKTVADPVGNEEQLLNPKRKGALVDLRCAPHEVLSIAKNGRFTPFRRRGDQLSQERAFSDQQNFLTSPDGDEIQGNRGEEWAYGAQLLWGKTEPNS